MNKYLNIGLIVLATLLLAGCGSKKKNKDSEAVSEVAADPNALTSSAAEAHFAKVTGNNTTAQNLVAKVHVAINFNDKELSTNGTLRMKKDDVIQLSLVDPVLGIMELGKMEFTESKVLVVVRIKKMYVEVPYAKVGFLKQANVDFNSLQSLFWNEIFEPGFYKPEAKSYAFIKDAGNINMGLNGDILAYKFVTGEKNGLLSKTEITGSKDTTYKLWFDYSNFTQFEKKPFPQNITLSFTDGKKETSLQMELSNIKNTSGWETRTSVPNGYEKADFDNIFKMLMQ